MILVVKYLLASQVKVLFRVNYMSNSVHDICSKRFFVSTANNTQNVRFELISLSSHLTFSLLSWQHNSRKHGNLQTITKDSWKEVTSLQSHQDHISRPSATRLYTLQCSKLQMAFYWIIHTQKHKLPTLCPLERIGCDITAVFFLLDDLKESRRVLYTEQGHCGIWAQASFLLLLPHFLSPISICPHKRSSFIRSFSLCSAQMVWTSLSCDIKHQKSLQYWTGRSRRAFTLTSCCSIH